MERDSTTVKCTLTEVDEPTPQTMYYIGKDSGIAEAKQRIRLIDGEQDTSGSK